MDNKSSSTGIVIETPSFTPTKTIAAYLAAEGIIYSTVVRDSPDCIIPEAAILKAVLLKDEKGIVMVVLPADQLIDNLILAKTLNRAHLQPLTMQEREEMLLEHPTARKLSPLPHFQAFSGIIAEPVTLLDKIYFEGDEANTFFELSGQAYCQLHKQLPIAAFSISFEKLGTVIDALPVNQYTEQFNEVRLKGSIQGIFEMPPIPSIAAAILRLRVDPMAEARHLAKIIGQDPSLAAQIMGWAQSPYYGCAGQVVSLEMAIVKVLGFDLVMNLALGIAAGKSMHIPQTGALGLQKYWRTSVYVSALVEQLVALMPVHKRPIIGLASLSGLLHDFGFLILGVMFPPHFLLLNNYLTFNPHMDMLKIEKQLLGLTHEQLGAWLLGIWRMPEEVVMAVRDHHQAEVHSANPVYAQLVYVAVSLFHVYDKGHLLEGHLMPTAVLKALELDEKQVYQALEAVTIQREQYDKLASQICS